MISSSARRKAPSGISTAVRLSDDGDLPNRGTTTSQIPVTGAHAENSDVLPFGSVAVEVAEAPRATCNGKLAVNAPFPLLSVVTVVWPRNLCPSPYPDGSQD